MRVMRVSISKPHLLDLEVADVVFCVYRNVSGSRRVEQCSWRKAAKGVL